MIEKNGHFRSCSILYPFVGICDIYLEKNLSNFYLGFDIEKDDTRLYYEGLGEEKLMLIGLPSLNKEFEFN